MTDRKVIPITGRHTTFHSLASEAIANSKVAAGFVIYFDEDGTMHAGDVGLTLANICMANTWISNYANKAMEFSGD